MLAREKRTATLAGLREHTSAAGREMAFGDTGLANFDGLVVGVFDEFSCERRRFLPVSENGNGMPGAGKRHIEQAALLRVPEILRFRKDQIEQRVIYNFRRESHRVGDSAQDDDVIGLKLLGGVNRHEADRQFWKLVCERVKGLRAGVMLASQRENACTGSGGS